ncbi:hypothetical protein Fmac_021638 [Flemingia macrophylla]|uniref:Uncharacterized protein n=1 Tax=Flemingia macrophylla TaxID=520843 RepID=A0ABD1LXF4_9FABA
MINESLSYLPECQWCVNFSMVTIQFVTGTIPNSSPVSCLPKTSISKLNTRDDWQVQYGCGALSLLL